MDIGTAPLPDRRQFMFSDGPNAPWPVRHSSFRYVAFMPSEKT